MSRKDLSVISLQHATLVSASTLGVGPYYVGDLQDFDVVVKSCATCTITYTIQFAPYEADWWTTADNFTSTSILEGSATMSVVSNHFANNNFPWMQINVDSSNTGGHATGTLKIDLLATRRR